MWSSVLCGSEAGISLSLSFPGIWGSALGFKVPRGHSETVWGWQSMLLAAAFVSLGAVLLWVALLLYHPLPICMELYWLQVGPSDMNPNHPGHSSPYYQRCQVFYMEPILQLLTFGAWDLQLFRTCCHMWVYLTCLLAPHRTRLTLCPVNENLECLG